MRALASADKRDIMIRIANNFFFFFFFFFRDDIVYVWMMNIVVKIKNKI